MLGTVWCGMFRNSSREATLTARIKADSVIGRGVERVLVTVDKMAGLSAVAGPLSNLPRMNATHYPSIPPKAPSATIAYARAINDAPITALLGVKGPKPPDKHQPASRHRMRSQVGVTNRWRLPEYLGSDLLGCAQALKATRAPLNSSLIKIITAESQRLSLNLDVSQPYQFLQRSGRAQLYGPHPPHQSAASEPPAKPLNPLPIIHCRTHRMPPIKQYIPGTVHPLSPSEVFAYLTKDAQDPTDVLLRCMDMDWELHRTYLHKSAVITEALKEADHPKDPHFYHGSESDGHHRHPHHSPHYTGSEIPRSLHKRLRKGLETAVVSRSRVNRITLLEMDIDEPLVTEHALAVALGNLYREEVEVEVEDVVGVMAAAHTLGIQSLKHGCGNIMLSTINHKTVCAYHCVASKFQESNVTEACESWLQVNLIPRLSHHIQLRQLSFEVLQKVIKSSRLFTFNEYSLYKMLCDWLFLQLNPDIQLMPCHSTILSYFNSFSKSCSLLEREETHIYEPLFSALRLHGVTDTNNLRDMQMMNIVPQAWIVNVLSLHYQGLQGGGDMTAFKNFSTACIRTGFIIDETPHYHSEILSLYGFHFELKAVKQEDADGCFSFYMQRLKPNDSVLSFRDCERHTFSLRPDRLVQYSIRVQCRRDGKRFLYSTRMLSQKFGLRQSISQSEVLTLEKLETPIHVTFSVLFPSS